MLTRRGFTLIEVLVSLVMISLVGLATAKLLRSMLNTTSAQVQIATTQGTLRAGVLALPQEFREIGYDTIPLAGLATTDLEAIARHRITFRAMRGLGTTCGTPTLTDFRIRKPVFGLRGPLLTDGVLLFVENDPNNGLDDQWVTVNVASIDYTSTCGADSAVAFTLAAAPLVDPGAGTPMAISNYFVGGPIRWFERLEYGPVMVPSVGAFVGVRSLSLGEPTLSPIIGPMPDTTSFVLEYVGATGASLNPAVAPPISVRSIGVRIGGVSERAVSLAGSTDRSQVQRGFATRVALRNTLRP